MNKSIVEKVLGVSNPYTIAYLEDTLRLTKSFVIHLESEADTYNYGVMLNHKRRIDRFDKRTWRYYKHLAGEYHEVDTPMRVISRDTREEIILNKDTLEVHIETLEELNLYGHFYDSVSEKYPEQTILLKSLMSGNKDITVDDVIDSKDWEIIHYNGKLVESQEGDLIHRLQDRIYNFSRKNLLLNYAISDNLYLAVLISSLYHFIYATLLSLRFKNIKTNRVHSFHLLNYLSSHHELDDTHAYLDDYQRLFLYRNLKYLDSHAGKNSTLDKLVDVFFDRKRMVVTNYEFLQLMTLRDDMSTDYRFIQSLLNKTKYSYDKDRFTIEELREKEINILENNKKEYDFNMDQIDFNLLNSLTNNVKTKDLEVNINDDSNSIRNKLLDIALDYWATTNELGYNNSLITAIDPTSGRELFLTSKEAFRLYYICLLYMFECTRFDHLPDINMHRILREDRPSVETLLGLLSKDSCLLRDEIEEIYVQAPRYNHMSTRSQFRIFIEKVHKYEMGMEMYLDSTGDLISYLDMERIWENLHTSIVIRNDNLDIKKWIAELELDDFMDYSKEQLLALAVTLFDAASDNVMEFNEIYRLTQQAVLKILSKFKSYTTQVLSNFHINDPRLVGPHTPRPTISGFGESSGWLVNQPIELNCWFINEEAYWEIRPPVTIDPGVSQRFEYDIDISTSHVMDIKENIEFEAIGHEITICLDEDSSTPDSTLTEEQARRIFEQERKLNNG